MAVDDIKGVQDNAVLKRLSILVENTLEVEYRLPKFFRSRYLKSIQSRKFQPNLYRNSRAIVRWFKGEPLLDSKSIKETMKPVLVSKMQNGSILQAIDQSCTCQSPGTLINRLSRYLDRFFLLSVDKLTCPFLLLVLIFY